MAIPRFGFLAVETFACGLMTLASVIGLVHGSEYWPSPWVPWATWEVSYGWRLFQAGLVLAGANSALGSRSFVVAAIGIAAGLIFTTRVGAITAGPSLFVLLLIARRFRAFIIFAPKWRGPGPRPIGYWR